MLFAAREPGTPFAAGDQLVLSLSPFLPDGATPLVTEPAEVTKVGLYYIAAFERS